MIPTADRLFVYRLIKAGFDDGRAPSDIADSICNALCVDRHWTPQRLRTRDDWLDEQEARADAEDARLR
jgi:hypothetical protein